MAGSLTDQAAVAVAIARAEAGPSETTIGHLLVGLATEPDGRAGKRLRERATAVLLLTERAGRIPAPPLTAALAHAARRPHRRAIGTVDLLDAALAAGGSDVADLLESVGFQRDLDGWLLGDPEHLWFDDAETLGWAPHGDDTLDPAASRVVAQARAVGGGAIEVLIAAAAAPEVALDDLDPEVLAGVAERLRHTASWDAGLDAVISTARVLTESPRATLRDLLRATLVGGGEGPRRILEAAERPA